ncbi:MAG: hypothetical protein WCV88_03420 [Patescibacteria group bacterium]|jgi:hypothetical protein
MATGDDPDYQRLATAVLERRPVLRELMDKQGHKTLSEYARLYTDVNLNPPIKKRQDEIISTITQTVESLFDKETAIGVGKQLEKHYFVSTSDHLGPMTDPSFTNANLLAATAHVAHQDPNLQFVLVLACSNISFRNISFPRGLLFHNSDQKNSLERINFVPATARACPVFNWPAYTKPQMLTVVDDVKKMARQKKVSLLLTDKIDDLLQKVYLDDTVLTSHTFAEQMTKTNDRLWQRFFGPHQVAPARLISIEQETIVTELILRYHLYQDTVIQHMLFDTKYEPELVRYFDDIMGAFSIPQQYGSYLFWSLPKGSKYKIALWKKGNFLETPDGSYRVELTPAAIEAALQKREIFPTTLMDFLVLSFYYGLKCLGGFNQINYLTDMKNAYIKMNVDRQNYRSIEVCARAQTKEMGDGYLLAYGQTTAGKLIPATGLDLYLYGTDKTWSTIQHMAKNLTVRESLLPAMPELYRYVTTEAQRDPALAAITPDQIVTAIDLNKKLEPCINFS